MTKTAVPKGGVDGEGGDGGEWVMVMERKLRHLIKFDVLRSSVMGSGT
jgi:GTPase involved in cell partitioning and DNA repair